MKLKKKCVTFVVLDCLTPCNLSHSYSIIWDRQWNHFCMCLCRRAYSLDPGHFRPKTLRTYQNSDLGHFGMSEVPQHLGTGAEVSFRHFGTMLKSKTKHTAYPKAYASMSENNCKFNPSYLYTAACSHGSELQSLVLTMSGCSASGWVEIIRRGWLQSTNQRDNGGWQRISVFAKQRQLLQGQRGYQYTQQPGTSQAVYCRCIVRNKSNYAMLRSYSTYSCLCVSVCLDVNQGGINHNRCTNWLTDRDRTHTLKRRKWDTARARCDDEGNGCAINNWMLTTNETRKTGNWPVLKFETIFHKLVPKWP